MTENITNPDFMRGVRGFFGVLSAGTGVSAKEVFELLVDSSRILRYIPSKPSGKL